jgi:hypothetical protein
MKKPLSPIYSLSIFKMRAVTTLNELFVRVTRHGNRAIKKIAATLYTGLKQRANFSFSPGYAKYLFIIVFAFLAYNAKARHADTTIFYFKNSGKVAVGRDSADYVRFIMLPDTNGDKDLYRVYDYFLNGKK